VVGRAWRRDGDASAAGGWPGVLGDACAIRGAAGAIGRAAESTGHGGLAEVDNNPFFVQTVAAVEWVRPCWRRCESPDLRLAPHRGHRRRVPPGLAHRSTASWMPICLRVNVINAVKGVEIGDGSPPHCFRARRTPMKCACIMSGHLRVQPCGGILGAFPPDSRSWRGSR